MRKMQGYFINIDGCLLGDGVKAVTLDGLREINHWEIRDPKYAHINDLHEILNEFKGPS